MDFFGNSDTSPLWFNRQESKYIQLAQCLHSITQTSQCATKDRKLCPGDTIKCSFSSIRKQHPFFFKQINRGRDGKLTTLANIVAVAKRALPKPSWKPMATDNAVTVAEWDDGMPPEPISCLGSHLFSLYLNHFRTSAHQT